jgi:acyl-CoA thioesterase-1
MFKRFHTVLIVLVAVAWPASAADRAIVVVGDSLSSGYGLGSAASWVAMLEDRLAHEAYGYEVVNASIAGDTSAGGLARLPRLLELHEPAVVVIELGGNDGLRGQPVGRLRENLARMIELAEDAGAEVVLTGIQIPPNYGPAYTESFSDVYRALAEQYEVVLVPFFMEGVALNAERMQGDGIHPNSAGQGPLLENVWSVLEELL